MLEGGGPADLGLADARRVAVRRARSPQRREGRDRPRARRSSASSGAASPPAADDGPSPAETALAVEELARAILKDAACGHLGTDLRATADEILLADGLAVGDGVADQRGGTAEWDAGNEEEAEMDEVEVEDDVEIEARRPIEPPAKQAADPVADFEWQSLPLDRTRLPRAEAPRAGSDPTPGTTPGPEFAQESDPTVDAGPRYGRDAPVVRGAEWEDDSRPR